MERRVLPQARGNARASPWRKVALGATVACRALVAAHR